MGENGTQARTLRRELSFGRRSHTVSAPMNPRQALSWRPLQSSDLAAVTELAQACLAVDGGQPFAADPAFLNEAYLVGAESTSGWAQGGARLVCASSLRWRPPRPSGETDRQARGAVTSTPVTTGLVHPRWRRHGIGRRAFDWAAATAAAATQAEPAKPPPLMAESEALGDGAHALYLSRGLAEILAEDVMQLAATAPVPAAQAPDALVLTEWGRADPARFYAVYAEAFRERPGYPGWSRARWVDWISDDEDFRPEWTLLASLDGTDAGFVAGAATGWIVQLGVVPAARGKNLGARLLSEAIGRMRSAGESTITLNVNVNNPHAAALYRRLGFIRTGRRARYQAQA